MQHREFDARIIGQAAYLHCQGSPFLGCFPGSNRRYVWRFANLDDQAWRLSTTWRERREALVNGPAFLESYRQMAAARDMANGLVFGLEHGKGQAQHDTVEQHTAA